MVGLLSAEMKPVVKSLDLMIKYELRLQTAEVLNYPSQIFSNWPLVKSSRFFNLDFLSEWRTRDVIIYYR